MLQEHAIRHLWIYPYPLKMNDTCERLNQTLRVQCINTAL
ncbi:transposase [Escherichia albertii]|nr:transposase [Escherichia coli]